MRKEIGAYEAKTRLPELLRRVEAGESFIITNRGKPIADIRPSRESSQVLIRAAIERLTQMQNPAIDDATLAGLKEQGRK